MKHVLHLEINDSVFSLLARDAHNRNVTLNEYCCGLLTLAVQHEIAGDNEPTDDPDQMTLKLDMGEPYAPATKEAVTQEACTKDVTKPVSKEPKDLTKPPFEPKKKTVPAPLKPKKVVGRWVDPDKKHTKNTWAF